MTTIAASLEDKIRSGRASVGTVGLGYVGLPLSVENIVMRARSIEVTLTRGMDAMAEFAMTANPNVANRLAIDPSSKDEFYAYYRRLTPIGYANSLRALLAMDHITDRLGELRMPVLLVGRALQGFGGGLLGALTYMMVRLVFPERL